MDTRLLTLALATRLAKPGSFDYTDPEETTRACRRLWQAVLLLALRDLRAGNARDRQSAIRFLEGGAAQAIAHHAGIPRAATRLTELLNDPPSVPAIVPDQA